MPKFKQTKIEKYKINTEDEVKSITSFKKQRSEFLTSEEKLEKKLVIDKKKVEYATGKPVDDRTSFAKALNIDKKSPWNSNLFWWPLHLINRPLQAVLHFIDSARNKENIALGFFGGLVGTREDIQPTEALGIDTKNWSGAGKFVTNLFLNIALDPITWATLGGSVAARTALRASATAVKTAQAYNAISKGQKLTSALIKGAKSSSSALAKGATLFFKKNQSVLKGLSGIAREKKIAELVLKESGGVIARNVYKVGKTLSKTQELSNKVGFVYLKTAKKVALKIPRVSSVYSGAVTAVNSGVRKLGFNFKFGYKLNKQTQEKLASLVSDKKNFLQKTTEFANKTSKAIDDLAETYNSVLKKQEINPAILKRLGIPEEKLKEEAQTWFKNNPNLFNRTNVTKDQMAELLSDQMAIQGEITKQVSQGGLHILENLNNTGIKLTVDENEALRVSAWVNKHLINSELKASVAKISTIDENLLKLYKLDEDAFSNFLTKEGSNGYVILLSQKNGAPISMQVDDFGFKQIKSESIRDIVKKIEVGDIELQKDETYKKLFTTFEDKVKIAKIESDYNKNLKDFIKNRYEERMRSPQWREFTDDVSTLVEETINDISTGSTNSAMLKQANELQMSLNKIKVGISKFQVKGNPDELIEIINFTKKLNFKYLKNQKLKILNDTFKKVKITKKDFVNLQNSVDKKLFNKFQNELSEVTSSKKLKQIVDKFTKKLNLSKEKIEALNKEVKQISVANKEMIRLLKKGTDPADLSDQIVGKIFKGLPKRLDKEEVGSALQMLKNYVSEDDFAKITGNFNPEATKVLNKRFAVYVENQLKRNTKVMKTLQKTVNKDLLKTYAQNLPKESLSGLQYADSPSYELIEKLIAQSESQYQKLRNLTKEWFGLSEELDKLGYAPKIQFGEAGEKMAILEQARRAQGISNISVDGYLPQLTYATSSAKVKTQMTFHRRFLDNGEYLNSVLGIKLFNTHPLSMLNQWSKNVDDLLVKPVLAIETFGGKLFKIIKPQDKLKTSIGDVTKDGFLTMSGKKASKLFEPLERLIDKKPQVIARYAENSSQALNFTKNFDDLQRQLKVINLQNLDDDSLDLVKTLKNEVLIQNHGTQSINKALARLQDKPELLNRLTNTDWIQDLEITNFNKETIQDLIKQLRNEDRVQLHGSIEQMMRPSNFSNQRIQKIVSFMDTINGMWKSGVLWSNFTGYHSRNILGNFINGYVGGVSSRHYISTFPKAVYRVAKYSKAMSKITKHQNALALTNVVDDASFIAISKKVLSKSEFDNFLPIYKLRRRGVMGHSTVREETWGLQAALDKLSRPSSDKSLLGPLSSKRRTNAIKILKVYDKNADWNQTFDDVHRLIIHDYFTKNPQNLAKMGLETADQATRIVGFDFNQMTKFEEKYLRRLIPFYSWARKNFEYHITNFSKNSVKYQRVIRTYTGWQKDLQNIKEDDLQDWQEQRNYLAVGKNLVKIEIPFLTYDETFGRKVLGRVNPFLKVMLETSTGKTYFYDKHLEDNELVSNAFDSFTTFSIQKRRWENRMKVLTGASNREMSNYSALAPSLFTELDRSKNQFSNLYKKVKKVDNQLTQLRQQGKTIPVWSDIATPRARINRRQILSG